MYVGPTGFHPRVNMSPSEVVNYLATLHRQGMITLDQLKEALPPGFTFVPKESPLTRELPAVTEMLGRRPVFSDPADQKRVLEALERRLAGRMQDEDRRREREAARDRQLELRKKSPAEWNLTKDQRIGDADREEMIAKLQRYFEQGYLTAGEFTARSDSVLVAKTVMDPQGVLADLPVLKESPDPEIARIADRMRMGITEKAKRSGMDRAMLVMQLVLLIANAVTAVAGIATGNFTDVAMNGGVAVFMASSMAFTLTRNDRG